MVELCPLWLELEEFEFLRFEDAPEFRLVFAPEFFLAVTTVVAVPSAVFDSKSSALGSCGVALG